MKKITLIFWICIAAMGSVLAQEAGRSIDVIHLTNGKKLEGKIQSYTPGESLTFKTLGGVEVTVLDYQLRKIGVKKLGKVKIKNLYDLPDKGFYHSYTLAILSNSGTGANGRLMGTEVSASAGYHFDRRTGVGLGLGWDNYHPAAGEHVMPIFAEVRRFIYDRASTPFILMRAGYGVALQNPDASIREASGGWMINPMAGWRLSGRKGMNLSLGLGVKFQKAQFIYETSASRSEIDLFYKRMQVQVGFMF